MRLALGLVALLLTTAAALAEPPPGSGGGKGMERMQKHLDLTDEQVEQIREIRQQGGSREDVQAVLTDEQRAKAEQMRGKHGKHRGDRMGKMQKHLDLSDEQVQQMREIREQGGSREDMHAVLTAEQKEKLDTLKRSHGGKGRHGKHKDTQD